MRHPFRPYPRFSLTKMNLVRPYPNLSPESHIVHSLAKHKNHMNSVWTLFWDKRTSRQTILQALRASHGIVPTAPSCKHKVEEKHCSLLKAHLSNGFFPQNYQCLNEHFSEIRWPLVRAYSKLSSERHMVHGSSQGTHMQTQSWRKTSQFTKMQDGPNETLVQILFGE